MRNVYVHEVRRDGEGRGCTAEQHCHVGVMAARVHSPRETAHVIHIIGLLRALEESSAAGTSAMPSALNSVRIQLWDVAINDTVCPSIGQGSHGPM